MKRLILAVLLAGSAFSQVPALGSGGGGGGGGTGCVPAGSSGQLLSDNGASGCTANSTAAGFLTFAGTSTSANLAALVTNETGSGPLVFATSPTFTAAAGFGVDGTTAGTLNVASAAAAHTTWASAATTSNTIAGPTVVPVTGDLVSCTSAATTCILTDSGKLAANVVTAAGTLTSTAIMTGGGSKASQTPSATATLDSSGNFSTPGGITTGAGGSTAGFDDLGAGTAHTFTGVGYEAPATITTPYGIIPPGAPTTGFVLRTGTSDPQTETTIASTGTANVVRSASPTLTGTITAAAYTGSGAFTNNGSYAGSAVVPTANIAVALANQTSLRGNAMAAAAGDATIGQVIAHGAKALDFASTATGACATVITDTATGTASTDVIVFTTNASIKAVTGYVPASTGGFSINAYPTTDTVNFEACNWTAGTVDPGSITVNWKVIR